MESALKRWGALPKITRAAILGLVLGCTMVVLVFSLTYLFYAACSHRFFDTKCVDRFHDFRLQHSTDIFFATFAVGAGMTPLLFLSTLWRSCVIALVMATTVTFVLFGVAQTALDAIIVGVVALVAMLLLLLVCGGVLGAFASVGGGLGAVDLPIFVPLIVDPKALTLAAVSILLGLLAYGCIDVLHLWDLLVPVALVAIGFVLIATLSWFGGMTSQLSKT
jgi:hypothetical protein